MASKAGCGCRIPREEEELYQSSRLGRHELEVTLLSSIGSALADPIISTRFIIVGLYQIFARVTLLNYSSTPIRPDAIEAQPSSKLQSKLISTLPSQQRQHNDKARGRFVFNILVTTIITYIQPLPPLPSSPSPPPPPPPPPPPRGSCPVFLVPLSFVPHSSEPDSSCARLLCTYAPPSSLARFLIHLPPEVEKWR